MVGYTYGNDSAWTSTEDVVRDQLVQIHPSDRQHVTKDDIARMREAGYLPIFAIAPVTLVQERSK